MKINSLAYDVGLWRRNSYGKVDSGRDGVLWDPQHRVLAIADGVGIYGFGHDDLGTFFQELRKHREIRSAVLATLHKDRRSTFVGVQLPPAQGGAAQVVHLGDSTAQLLWEGGLTELTEEHTYWTEIIKKHPEFRCLSELWFIMGMQNKEEIIHTIVAILRFINSKYKVNYIHEISRRMQLSFQFAGELHWLRMFLKTLVWRMSNTSILTLAHSRESVAAELSKQMVVPVELDDIFLLHSDGMDVKSKQVEEILRREEPVDAAKILAEESKREDDCSVGVVRVRKRKRREVLDNVLLRYSLERKGGKR